MKHLLQPLNLKFYKQKHMLFTHLLSVLAYELDQQFIPNIILTKGNSFSPKEYEVKDTTSREFKNKEQQPLNNREVDYSSNSSGFNPVLRTIVITRGTNPFSRPLRHNRMLDDKEPQFSSDRRDVFNHDYPHHQSYLPFYFEHIPQASRRVSSKSLDDVVKGKNGAFPDKSTGLLVFKTLMLLIAVLISGFIGFYFGKLQESRNYVRVGIPHHN